MVDPGRAWERLRQDRDDGDESWTQVYRRNDADTAYERAASEDPPGVAVDPGSTDTPISGTPTPGNDAYDASLDTFRYRQTIIRRERDPFHHDTAFSW